MESALRRSETAAYVAWNCDIDQATLDEFTQRMPFQGARVWAITAGLEALITQVQYSPRQQRIIHEAIQKMLKAGPPKLKATVNIRLKRNLDEQFAHLFPEWGASTWFMRSFMEQLVAHMTQYNVALIQLADVAVTRLLTRTSNEEQGDDKPAA